MLSFQSPCRLDQLRLSPTNDTACRLYAQAPVGAALLSVDDEPGVLNAGLLDIQRMLEEHNKTLEEFPDMPIPTAPPAQPQHRLLREELAYDRTALAADVAAKLLLLTPEQRTIFDAVLQAVDGPPQV